MLTTVARPRAAKSEARKRGEAETRQRIERLLQSEIKFLANDAFLHVDHDMEQRILRDAQTEPSESTRSAAPGLPAHFARLCRSEPLSAAVERELFFRKNYLQFRANVLRSRLDPTRPDAATAERIESLLQAAQRIRDRIVAANTRLVMSVVKKFVTPQHPFEDLFSEGVSALIRCVDSFDYARGYRFSTYAYRAISRRASRAISDDRRRASRFVTGTDSAVLDACQHGEPSQVREMAQNRLDRQVRQLIDQLDRRDRFIVRCRYALGNHRKTKTCQELANKLGLSKERVRQLEHRAIAKLRSMASAVEFAELAELACG
jgi:RNA polymerase primary sigma factor